MLNPPWARLCVALGSLASEPCLPVSLVLRRSAPRRVISGLIFPNVFNPPKMLSSYMIKSDDSSCELHRYPAIPLLMQAVAMVNHKLPVFRMPSRAVANLPDRLDSRCIRTLERELLLNAE